MTETVTQAPTLTELLRQLARARQLHQSVKQEIAASRAAFEQSIAPELEAERGRAAAVVTLEREVKALAESHFLATREKKPAEGVAIKEFETLNYDEVEAFAWAKKAGIAIVPESLDRKAFEKIAKASSLPFVYAIIEPRAQIAADLSSLLEG